MIRDQRNECNRHYDIITFCDCVKSHLSCQYAANTHIHHTFYH